MIRWSDIKNRLCQFLNVPKDKNLTIKHKNYKTFIS